MSRKKKKNESEFDRKMITWLFVVLFATSFIVEAAGRYMYYRSKKGTNA